MATPQGQAEYQRIIDQAAAVGCPNILYAPANSALSSRADSTDAWGWENVLWLGLGQKIRQGKWDPESDPVPPSVKTMQEYAAKRGVKFVAYVYPSLKWRPAWNAGDGGVCRGQLRQSGVSGLAGGQIGGLPAEDRRERLLASTTGGWTTRSPAPTPSGTAAGGFWSPCGGACPIC